MRKWKKKKLNTNRDLVFRLQVSATWAIARASKIIIIYNNRLLNKIVNNENVINKWANDFRRVQMISSMQMCVKQQQKNNEIQPNQHQ